MILNIVTDNRFVVNTFKHISNQKFSDALGFTLNIIDVNGNPNESFAGIHCDEMITLVHTSLYKGQVRDLVFSLHTGWNNHIFEYGKKTDTHNTGSLPIELVY